MRPELVLDDVAWTGGGFSYSCNRALLQQRTCKGCAGKDCSKTAHCARCNDRLRPSATLEGRLLPHGGGLRAWRYGHDVYICAMRPHAWLRLPTPGNSHLPSTSSLPLTCSEASAFSALTLVE